MLSGARSEKISDLLMFHLNFAVAALSSLGDNTFIQSTYV